MSTIEDLVAAGAILPIEVEMSAGDQPMRLLYGTPGFISWLGEIVSGTGPKRRLGDATPAEQIDDLELERDAILGGEQHDRTAGRRPRVAVQFHGVVSFGYGSTTRASG